MCRQYISCIGTNIAIVLTSQFMSWRYLGDQSHGHWSGSRSVENCSFLTLSGQEGEFGQEGSKLFRPEDYLAIASSKFFEFI